jgi:hypothetical protein
LIPTGRRFDAERLRRLVRLCRKDVDSSERIARLQLRDDDLQERVVTEIVEAVIPANEKPHVVSDLSGFARLPYMFVIRLAESRTDST